MRIPDQLFIWHVSSLSKNRNDGKKTENEEEWHLSRNPKIWNIFYRDWDSWTTWKTLFPRSFLSSNFFAFCFISRVLFFIAGWHYEFRRRAVLRWVFQWWKLHSVFPRDQREANNPKCDSEITFTATLQQRRQNDVTTANPTAKNEREIDRQSK